MTTYVDEYTSKDRKHKMGELSMFMFDTYTRSKEMSTCPIENPSAQIKDFYSLHHWVRMKQKYGKEI